MSRHLAIGDIHGCANALNALLESIALNSDDVLVTLGDYVDRGPDSRAVLDLLISLREKQALVPLRGNHEIMMLDAREKKSWFGPWLQYGGDATLRSYAGFAGNSGSFDDVPVEHIDFLQSSLLSHYESETHFFVHANAAAKVPIENQTAAALYWQKYKDPDPHCSGKIMVCGHTAQRDGIPRTNGHSICIDTWAYGGGWLSCLDVESGKVYQANEAGAVRDFGLDEIDTVPGLELVDKTR